MKKPDVSLKGLRLLSQVIPSHEHWKIKILNRWATIAEQFSKNIHIKKIEGETLFVQASHPAWAQEFRFSTDEILEKINRLCGEKKITKIICLGSGLQKKAVCQESLKYSFVQHTLFSVQSTTELSDQERAALNVIQHKKLASSMAEFYQQCKRRVLLRNTDSEQRKKSYDLCPSDCTCPVHEPVFPKTET